MAAATFAVVGLALLGLSAYSAWHAIRLRTRATRATRATGAVVDHATYTTKGTIHYLPIVRFRAEGGEFAIRSRIPTKTPRPIGQPWEVLYWPERPEAAKLRGFRAQFTWPLVLLLWGGFALAASLTLPAGRRGEARPVPEAPATPPAPAGSRWKDE